MSYGYEFSKRASVETPMTQSLTDFFRDKQQRSVEETRGIDWEGRRREWLDNLGHLYALVETVLAEPIVQGTAQISRRPRQITEDHLGTYDVEELILTVGDERVTFAPAARNVIGAAGRVDVRGERGEAMLVVQPGPRWSIVESKYPQLRTIPLDEATLADLLQGVMRA